MRSLFLTHRLPYAPNRGDRIRAYYLLREMSRFAEVSLFSLVHTDEEAAHVTDVPFARAVVSSRVSRVGNLVRASASLLSDRPLTHSLLDADDVQEKLTRMVRDHRPDVVVAYCSGMARFALEPPLDALPFVLDMVDVDSAKWADLSARTTGPKKWVYRREASTLRAFEAAVTSHSRATLVVNERERDTLAALAPGADVEVMSNGIDVDAFRAPAGTVRAPAVIFCGVLNYEPNEQGVLWFLEHVWPRVAAAQPKARFRIVGAHPTRAIQRAAAASTAVDLIGAVPAVQPHLWTSAVSVAPLHLARGLQNKVLEALAAGLPVVATSVVRAGLPADTQAACLEADDAEAFAGAVVSLLARGEDERDAMVRSAPLDALGWEQRLAPLEGILRAAAAHTEAQRTTGRFG